MKYTAKTDIGLKRNNNEDFFYAKEYDDNTSLFIVADGLGGYSGGEVASKVAVDCIKNEFETKLAELKKSNYEEIKNFFNHVISIANEKIYKIQKSNEKYKDMGTTIVLLGQINGKMYYSSVGDSRLYYIDEAKTQITQITEDDTYVNELLKKNLIKISEAKTHPQRHVLTKALGIFSKIDVKVEMLDKTQGYFILCSDGLTNMVTNKEILTTVCDNNFLMLSDILVDIAITNGGSDNITVIVVKI